MPSNPERRRLRIRAMMRLYRRDYPEKAKATLRACYWRKRVRALTLQLEEARMRVAHWQSRVDAMRWPRG